MKCEDSRFPRSMVGACAVLAAALMYIATWHGLIISTGDGMQYIFGAKSLYAGEGFAIGGKPITHYPPLYSMAVAASMYVSADAWSASRWLHIALFAGSIVAGAVLAWLLGGRSKWGTVFAAAVLTTSPLLLGCHANLLSEPLFIFLGLVGAIFLCRGLAADRNGLLFCSAACFGLSAACRYSGVVWIATGTICVLVWSRPLVRGVFRAIWFGALGVLPLGLFVLRNLGVSGSAANRPLQIHPISTGHVREFFEVLPAWFLPDRFSQWPVGAFVFVSVLVLSIGFGLRLFRGVAPQGSPSQREQQVALTLVLLFIAIYLIHLVLSITFLDFSTPLDARLQSPMMAVVLPFVVAGTAYLVQMPGVPTHVRYGVISLSCVLLAVSAFRSANLSRSQIHNARGFRGPVFQDSELVRTLRLISPERVIYSNKPPAITVGLEREALPLPHKHDPLTLVPNPQLREQLDEVAARMVNEGALVVYLFEEGLKEAPAAERDVLSRRHLLKERDLIELLPLQVLLRTKEGAVYQATRESAR